MCGIAGYLNLDGQHADRELLLAMAASLKHRGPDGEGIHSDGPLGLAHRRLSILDLSGGAQPMTTRDGSAWIIFNGEIYNFVELRRELEKRRHPFSTSSDTEVILHLYEERGADCVLDLRGMFAFALWDAPRRRLMLARDRLGIKPLYYYLADSVLVFGSELKSVLLHPRVRRDVDPVAVSEFLAHQYIPAPRTVFADVKKLPPAHVLIAENGRTTLRRYWRLPAVVEERPEDAWREELETTLEEAVRIHMRSDVPVGALLSGGIDSSLVVALAARSTPQPLQTFTVGLSDPSLSEVPFAREVAKRYHTVHTEYTLEPQAIVSIPALVGHFDEPFADSSAIACSHIARVASQHVKVCLSGDGGDEAFAGYDAYLTGRHLARADLIPLALRRLLLGPIERRVPEWIRGKGLLRFLTLAPADRYAELMGSIDFATRDWLLTREFQASIGNSDPDEKIRAAYESFRQYDEVARMQRTDVETYLPDDILVKADRTSMLHSLELRVPLLDHKVVELAFRMPTSMKIRRGTGKAILKQTFAQYLPPGILSRPKRGFVVPLNAWFRGELLDFAREVFEDSRTRQRGILAPAGLKRLLDSHLRGSRSLSSKIWTALVLEIWFRECVDCRVPVAAQATP